MTRRFAPLALVLALMLGMPAASAQTEDPAGDPDGYVSGTYGRIRYEESGVTIVRSATGEDFDRGGPATVNDPIFPGDSIRTDEAARAEVQLAAGTLVRIDRGANVKFVALPDPYAEVQDNTIVELSEGAIQLAATVKNQQEFRVETPAAVIYLLGDGEFQVAVARDGTTRVHSRRGVAEVTGAGASVLVRGGTRTVVAPDAAPDDPHAARGFSGDEFDAWIESRSSAYQARESGSHESDVDAYEQIPVEVRPYYRELSSSGRWVYLPTYGYAWYPIETVPGWRPYYAGGWQYGPGGYFWVSSEPWGWAPYHYGRWTWATGFGWCWLPGSVFGGAWVSWSWGSSHVGWCPLDYWNHPASCHPGGHGYDAASWTVVGYQHFGHSNSGRYAVPVDRVGGLLQTSAVVTRAPRASPRVLAGDAVARQRTVSELAAHRGVRATPDAAGGRATGRSFADTEREVLRSKLPPVPARPLRTSAAPREVPRDRTVGRTAAPREFVRPGEVTSRRGAVPRSPALGGPPAVIEQLREGSAANDSVRELYRRAAGPRVTRERTTHDGSPERAGPPPGTRSAPSPPAAAPRRSGAPAARPAPSAQPRSTPPSRSATGRDSRPGHQAKRK